MTWTRTRRRHPSAERSSDSTATKRSAKPSSIPTALTAGPAIRCTFSTDGTATGSRWQRRVRAGSRLWRCDLGEWNSGGSEGGGEPGSRDAKARHIGERRRSCRQDAQQRHRDRSGGFVKVSSRWSISVFETQAGIPYKALHSTIRAVSKSSYGSRRVDGEAQGALGGSCASARSAECGDDAIGGAHEAVIPFQATGSSCNPTRAAVNGGAVPRRS